MMDPSDTRRRDIFFYGLYMDVRVLRGRGLNPARPRLASLEGFDIEIIRRATLIPMGNSVVHGVVTSLTAGEIHRLYAEEGLEDYEPVTVPVTVGDGIRFPALCFIAPAGTESGRNREYALRLLDVARDLGLPKNYVRRLEAFL